MRLTRRRKAEDVLRQALEVVALFFMGAPVAAQPELLDLGPVPGANPFSVSVSGLSGDGSTVCGFAALDNEYRAFRWQAASGYVFLPVLGPNQSSESWSYAFDVSATGAVAVGASSSLDGSRAVSWGPAGMTNLGASTAQAVNATGSVIVGVSGNMAVRWAGSMQSLGFLPDTNVSIAADVSANGIVVVGHCLTNSSLSERAFRWTPSGGMLDLGQLPGWTNARATAVSGNGAVVFGNSGSRVFRWTQAQGMQDIAPGDTVYAANGDGSVAIYQSVFGPMIWRSGVNSVRSFAFSHGLDLTGWSINTAEGLNNEGSAVAGVAIHDGQWRAFLLRGLCTQSPSILGAPQIITRCVPATVILEASATGVALTYRWQVESPLGSGIWANLVDGPWAGGLLIGTTLPTLQLTATAPIATTNFRCSVSNPCGNATTNLIRLTVVALAGDFNLDGIVAMADLELIAPCFGGPGAANSGCTATQFGAADFDDDSDLDMADIAQLQRVVGTICD